jgi:hypothetical protein
VIEQFGGVVMSDPDRDTQSIKWAAELSVAIWQLIVDRSPKAGDQPVVDQHASLQALLQTSALLIAGSPPKERQWLFEQVSGRLAQAIDKFAADPQTRPFTLPVKKKQ